MAEFCTQCAKLMFGNIEPDINIRKIGSTLENETYIPVICEGCGMMAVEKDINGTIRVAIPTDINNFESRDFSWVNIDDFERDHATEYWYHAIKNIKQ